MTISSQEPPASARRAERRSGDRYYDQLRWARPYPRTGCVLHALATSEGGGARQPRRHPERRDGPDGEGTERGGAKRNRIPVERVPRGRDEWRFLSPAPPFAGTPRLRSRAAPPRNAGSACPDSRSLAPLPAVRVPVRAALDRRGLYTVLVAARPRTRLTMRRTHTRPATSRLRSRLPSDTHSRDAARAQMRRSASPTALAPPGAVPRRGIPRSRAPSVRGSLGGGCFGIPSPDASDRRIPVVMVFERRRQHEERVRWRHDSPERRAGSAPRDRRGEGRDAMEAAE